MLCISIWPKKLIYIRVTFTIKFGTNNIQNSYNLVTLCALVLGLY